MRFPFVITLLLILCSCETREIKYSASNDMFLGVQQVILYENGEFYLELILGGREGIYTINDTVVDLKYKDGYIDGWPNKLLMTDRYFITVDVDSTKKTVKFLR